MSAAPDKYAYLRRAEQAGIRIPRSLLLAPGAAGNLWQAFVAEAGGQQRFIVRSANPGEDGFAHSHAGHFWSSPPVTRAGLPAVLEQGWRENRMRLQRDSASRHEQPQLLLQDYVEHELGGVLFTPWSFFPDYACVEFSRQGAQGAVQGQSCPAVIPLTPGQDAPLPFPEPEAFLLPALQALCHRLKTVFSFAMDVEWAWDQHLQTVVVLQVRPQTYAVGAVLPLPAAQRQPGDNHEYTALSESLGRLSPLSFSLLEQLYREWLPDLRALGYRAEAVDFLCYQPDGTVLVDTARERRFYAPTFWGGFRRGWQAPARQQHILHVLQSWDAGAAFDFATLSLLFRAWMTANLLSAGHGRKVAPAAHAYELSWQQGPVDTELLLPQADWANLNACARQYYLHELHKLRVSLRPDPALVFCLWDEFVRADTRKAMPRQHAQARLAVFDHVVPADPQFAGRGLLSLAGRGVAEGAALVVSQPVRQPGDFPSGCILVAPYFDNRWVGSMAALRGVVVRQGGRLSHSAIVARELGIPYAVLPELDLQSIHTGQPVRLDTVRGVFELC